MNALALIGDERDVDGLVVRANQIIGTDLIVVTVWEIIDTSSGYTTLTYDERRGRWIGRYGSAPLPTEIAALPYGDERTEAVRLSRARRSARAVQAAEKAYPGLLSNLSARVRSGGDVEVGADDFRALILEVS